MRLVLINVSTVLGYNSGFFYLYPRPKYANILAGLIKSQSQPVEGSGRFEKDESRKGCHTTEVPAWAWMFPQGIEKSDYRLYVVRN